MFRKLKQQFMLTNLTIITFLFVTLTAGVYIVLQINMINHARVFTKRITEGIKSGIFPEIPLAENDRPHHFNGRPPMGNRKFPEPGTFRPLGPPPDKNRMFSPFFYIRSNSQGNIIVQPPGLPFAKSDLEILAQQVYKTRQNSGLINFSHSKYFFIKQY
jgi:two-component system sensor histidine kinase CiaH